MKSVYSLLFVTVLIISLSSCAKKSNQVKIPKDAVQMDIQFSWDEVKACTHSSPPIHVSNIPDGVKEFHVSLTNLSVPAWNQGGGHVLNDGSGLIPAGSLNLGFNGPCLPPGQRQNYEFSVIAVDSDGIILGFGKKKQPFPPK